MKRITHDPTIHLSGLRSPLLPSLATLTPEQLHAAHGCELLTFERGETLFRQGDPLRALHIIVSGELQGMMIVSNGEMVEVDRMGPGAGLAVALLFSDHARYPVDVVSITAGILWRIPTQAYRQMLGEYPELLHAFLRASANAFFRLTEKLNLVSTKSLRAKIALFVLSRTSEGCPTFTLQRTRTDLANYLGVQRPSLSRTLSELQERGLIQLTGREVTVLDRRGLQMIT